MSLTLEKFDFEEDSSSLTTRWERWKRALFVYLDTANVEKPEKKRANLLHFGGTQLQEIFYNLPGANVEPEEGVDVFEIALSKLNDYFAPKQCKVYERHLFRLLKQESNERLEKFTIRLRQQANKCDFKDRDSNIVDQITEKCSSNVLRKKILEIGDEITLERIIKEANAIEALSEQLGKYNNIESGGQNINKIDLRPRKPFNQRKYDSCCRCGNRHRSDDPVCPAREKNCLKCGIKGHFRQFCRTKPVLKRKTDNQKDDQRNEQKRGKFSRKSNFPRVNQVNNVSETNEKDPKCQLEDEYVFHIDDDVEFDCSIGEVITKVLVDSGCNKNLISEDTWKYLKRSRVQVFNQIANPDVQFFAYGSKEPLKVKGSFEATVKMGNKSETSTFYVVAGGTRNLLGRATATSLGILKIGLDLRVNNIVTEELPKFKDLLIHLPIDDSVTPISQPYRRIPIPLEAKVDTKIEELLKLGIIEKVLGSSKWVSPMVTVLKDNGDVRLCIDMRRANQAIIRENHPLPTMDKILPKIKDAKFFSKLDIKDAFHQIELHPDSRHITTFIASKGLYRYKRLMFGISCAPEIFQKTLEHMLLGCKGVINFIDDILVYGKDLQEHNERLDKVIAVLKKNNVLLRDDKCEYRLKKVSFLGHELSDQGVRPLKKFISTIHDFRPPETISELQSFFGLVNYISKWIPNFATITEPLKIILRNKTSGRTNIQNMWGPKQQHCFDLLKSSLTQIQTLGFYDPKDRTLVFADASPVGLGAVLIQINHEGPRIIAYGHKTLTDCERRYCQTEKEALALVWAVEHFHIFLYGKLFELVTDHKPLEVIFGIKSKPSARIERWVMRLQAYNYRVVYKPGKNNIADPLSRLCCHIPNVEQKLVDNHILQIVECTRPVAVSLKEIMANSKLDPEIVKVKEGVYNNNWDDDVKLYKIFQNELCYHEDILLRGTRIVIPANLRERVLKAAHEGHPGIVAMKARLRTKVWWPKCDRDAENIVKSCKGCTLVSAPTPPNPLKRRELPVEPWVDIAIDLMGPLPSGDYLLVVVDYYSRYKEVKICRKITSAEIIAHLKEIFSRLGNPSSITADNAKQFTSEEFKAFSLERNITIFNTIPYWPQQNGEVERQNRDILKRLKISQVEKQNWRESLLEYMCMYNSTPHSTTGKTPSDLFFNRKFRDKLPMISDVSHGSYMDTEIRDKDLLNKEKGKEYADKKRKAKKCELEPGDKVYLKNMTKENKLSLNYDPTTHTVEKNNEGDISVRNDETGQVYRRNVIHLKKIEGEWQVCEKENNNDNLN